VDRRAPDGTGLDRRGDAAQLKQPLLLALDLSTNVGWCLMRRYEAPKFGTAHLSGDYMSRLGQYHLWLASMLDEYRPNGIAWEGAIKKPTDTLDKLVFLYGLIGITAGFRVAYRLPYVEVPITMAKKVLTGNSYADKDLMIAKAMSTMNWEVEDDHQADAGAVGMVAYDNLWQK
jgi:Holliday junction resolvasome RuvABC endonuclease subunit